MANGTSATLGFNSSRKFYRSARRKSRRPVLSSRLALSRLALQRISVVSIDESTSVCLNGSR